MDDADHEMTQAFVCAADPVVAEVPGLTECCSGIGCQAAGMQILGTAGCSCRLWLSTCTSSCSYPHPLRNSDSFPFPDAAIDRC